MFSVDFNLLAESVFNYSGIIITAMMPIIGISSGFTLGFRLVSRIGSMFSRAL